MALLYRSPDTPMIMQYSRKFAVPEFMADVMSHEHMYHACGAIEFCGDSSFFNGSGKRHLISKNSNCIVICYMIVEPLGLEH